MTSSTNTKKGKRSVKRVVGIVVSAMLAAALMAVIAAANTVLPKFNQIINSYFGVEQSWDNSEANADGLDLTYNKADYDRGSIAEAEKALDLSLIHI